MFLLGGDHLGFRVTAATLSVPPKRAPGFKTLSKQRECVLSTQEPCSHAVLSFPHPHLSQAPQSVKWSGSQRTALVTPMFPAAAGTGATRGCSARGEARAGVWMPEGRRSMELGAKACGHLVVGCLSRAFFLVLIKLYNFHCFSRPTTPRPTHSTAS